MNVTPMGFISEDAIRDFSQNFSVSRPNNPLDLLFPDEKTQNLVEKYNTISSDYLIPTMATAVALDAEAPIANRSPLNVVNVEKAAIKRKINQTESLRLHSRGIVQNDYTDYVLDDASRLAEQVNTRAKVAKGEAMASGLVTFKENGLNITVDYQVPTENKSITVDWSAPDADIPGDLDMILNQISNAGGQVNSVLTSNTVMTLMRRNAAMQKVVLGNIGAGATVPRQIFTDYLNSEYQLSNMTTLDLKYAVEQGVDANGSLKRTYHRYYPEAKMTFYLGSASGAVGAGLWGTTAEETTSGPYTELSQRQFITITQWATPDPPDVWTKASGLFIPALYAPSNLFIVTVKLPAASAALRSNAKNAKISV